MLLVIEDLEDHGGRRLSLNPGEKVDAVLFAGHHSPLPPEGVRVVAELSA